MANRHRKSGGKVGGGFNVGGATPYTAEKSNVRKEALEKKHGGRAAHKRLDKRAKGGRVGADKHPFSSAHVK